MTTNKLLLSPQECAESLGVSRATAYRLIASGQLPSVRFGASVRVPLTGLRRWVKQQQVPPTKR